MEAKRKINNNTDLDDCEKHLQINYLEQERKHQKHISNIASRTLIIVFVILVIQVMIVILILLIPANHVENRNIHKNQTLINNK